ncbi:MAG: universal stress protein [bacterium]|nr:universal stress protein [bacterium]
MKNIAVLIDFTEGSITALVQAETFAKKIGATLHAVNIAPSPDKIASATSNLTQFLEKYAANSQDIKLEVGEGNLFTALPTILGRFEPSLVIVCTHGIKGMFQHLFGAHILKLVQSIPYPSIVIQENNQTDISSINKILFPLGPHPDFSIKIKQTIALALILQAEVYLYKIERPGMGYEDQLDQNFQHAKNAFTENKITTHRVIDELQIISAGYSRQTIEYAYKNQIQIISLMASVSNLDLLFGVGDKENFMVNTYGIPILCCME